MSTFLISFVEFKSRLRRISPLQKIAQKGEKEDFSFQSEVNFIVIKIVAKYKLDSEH